MALNPDRELIEQALPGYEVGVELGRGAWGVVISGRHLRLDRRVAIKQLPRAFAADPAVSERFLHEARMAASLEHPHIVPVYDYVEQDGLALIVMELCPSTIAERFHSDGIHTDEACAAILATCSALAYAHGRNVLHRDIKPENLLVDDDGVVKLGDFGIARALDAATRLTATGTVLGTPAYMSPEQAGGEDLGPHSDVYSTGVVLYELLSGDLPFAETDSVGALMRQHLFEPARPLLEAKPDIPQRIAAVVDRSLVKDPEKRYPSASELGSALGEATAHAFGAGWLRQRRFALLGAPEIIAATEKEVGGAGRGGTIVVRGHAQEVVAPEIDDEASETTATIAPTGARGMGDANATVAPFSADTSSITESSAEAEPEVSGASSLAPPPGFPTPAPAPGAAPPAPTSPTTGTGGANRKVWLAVGGIVAALVVLFVLVFVAAGGGGDDSADGSGGDTPADTAPGTTAPTTDEPAGDQAPDDQAPGDDAVDGGDPIVDAPDRSQLVLGTLIDDSEFADDGDQVAAMDLALADVNDAGGVLGQPLELRPGTYTDEATMGIVAGEHMETGASAIIGPSDPIDTTDILPTVTGSGVILMSPTDWFSRPDETGLYFQTRVPGPLVGIGAILLLPEGTSSVAVVVDGDGLSSTDTDTQMVIANQLTAQGIAGTRVDVIDDDVASAAARVAAINPDAVIIHGLVGLTDLYNALIDAGVGPATRPYVVAGNDGGAVNMGEGQITGVIGIVRDFLTGDELEDRVPGADFSADAAQAYDAVMILALAAEAAGTVDPAAMAARLPDVTAGGEPCDTFATCKELLLRGVDFDYVGPGGPYEISPRTGRPNAGFYRVSIIDDSGFALSGTERVTIRGPDV